MGVQVFDENNVRTYADSESFQFGCWTRKRMFVVMYGKIKVKYSSWSLSAYRFLTTSNSRYLLPGVLNMLIEIAAFHGAMMSAEREGYGYALPAA